MIFISDLNLFTFLIGFRLLLELDKINNSILRVFVVNNVGNTDLLLMHFKTVVSNRK